MNFTTVGPSFLTRSKNDDIIYTRNSSYTDGAVAKYGIGSMFLIGMVGNGFGLTLMFYRKLYRRSIIFIFFFFITLFDTLKVVFDGGTVVVRRWIYFYQIKAADNDNIHGRLYLVSRYFGESTQLVSVWILMFANAYKLYALVKPLRVRALNKNIAVYLCLATVVLFFGFNLQIFWTFKIVDIKVNNSTVYVTWDIVDKYRATFFSLYPPFIIMMYVILPSAVLFVLSIGIIVCLRRCYKKHLSLRGTVGQEDTIFLTALRSSLALLPLSLIHFSFTFPVELTVNINRKFISHTSLLLLLTNHSLNVYVQMIFSRYYRNAILGKE